MEKNRMEAFSDGVLAIIITIMVLELTVPRGASFTNPETDLPVFLGYVLSFIYIGIYWTNHHHLLMMVDTVNGQILWANLHLLFWLSLIPASTAWADEHPLTTAPACVYGIILLMCSVAYIVLQNLIIHLQGRESQLAKTLGKDYKGKVSMVGMRLRPASHSYSQSRRMQYTSWSLCCGSFLIFASKRQSTAPKSSELGRFISRYRVLRQFRSIDSDFSHDAALISGISAFNTFELPQNSVSRQLRAASS